MLSTGDKVEMELHLSLEMEYVEQIQIDKKKYQ